MASAGAACAAGTQGKPLTAWRASQPPSIALVDQSGRPTTLNDFRGKVLVANLWATWCAPCVSEMPSLDRLRAETAGLPVAVVAISVGDSLNQIDQFLRRVPVQLTILLDSDKKVLDAWRVKALPTTYIFDASGKLRYSFSGERDWSDSTVRRTIESLLPK